jgi:hypothetical protein
VSSIAQSFRACGFNTQNLPKEKQEHLPLPDILQGLPHRFKKRIVYLHSFKKQLAGFATGNRRRFEYVQETRMVAVDLTIRLVVGTGIGILELRNRKVHRFSPVQEIDFWHGLDFRQRI